MAKRLLIQEYSVSSVFQIRGTATRGKGKSRSQCV